jgi:hypothetical protein
MAEIVTVKSAADSVAGPPAHPAHPVPGPHILAAYKQMLVALFVSTLLISAAAMAITLGFHYGQTPRRDPPLMVILIFAGALGAFFSALIRLYNFADLPKALIEPGLGKLRSGYLMIYSLVPPVMGAIAATILYITFAAGLLQGVMFPEFECKVLDVARKISDCNTFGHTISDFGPKVATDYAKCLVWAFIAGFAERLVPDALQSFAAKASKAEPPAPPPER